MTHVACRASVIGGDGTRRHDARLGAPRLEVRLVGSGGGSGSVLASCLDQTPSSSRRQRLHDTCGGARGGRQVMRSMTLVDSCRDVRDVRRCRRRRTVRSARRSRAGGRGTSAGTRFRNPVPARSAPTSSRAIRLARPRRGPARKRTSGSEPSRVPRRCATSVMTRAGTNRGPEWVSRSARHWSWWSSSSVDVGVQRARVDEEGVLGRPRGSKDFLDPHGDVVRTAASRRGGEQPALAPRPEMGLDRLTGDVGDRQPASGLLRGGALVSSPRRATSRSCVSWYAEHTGGERRESPCPSSA